MNGCNIKEEISKWDEFQRRIDAAKTHEEKLQIIMERTEWLRKLD